MILLTTSRRPTRSVRTLCRDLSHVIPGVLRVNRGKMSKDEIAEKALEVKAEKVVIINRWKGGPGKIELFKLDFGKLQPIPPLIYLRGVKLRREIPGALIRGRRIRTLAIEELNNSTGEIGNLKNALKNFFDLPVASQEEAKKGMYDALMRMKIDQTGCIIVTFMFTAEKRETGPRMIISHLIWEI
ncbi:MAG: hypothetical protein QW056_06780 [Candidatus Bathyarchaeia archaeon]